MMNRGGIQVDLSNLVGKVYNLCRVKFYSNSRVLGHGRLEWSLSSPMPSFDFIKVFLERKGERCLTEYSEGTVVARGWFGVLVG
jgi:hypothetical protein